METDKIRELTTFMGTNKKENARLERGDRERRKERLDGEMFVDSLLGKNGGGGCGAVSDAAARLGH